MSHQNKHASDASDESARLTTIPGTCPTPSELGVSGWNILHSSAAVYPYKPSPVQQTAMKNFIESWAHVYACSWCAYHMRQYVQEHPPDVRDKESVSRYLCELHNEVSERLGKDEFDCSPDVVLRRWHPGYPHKMGDKPTIEEQLAQSAREAAAAKEAKQRQREEEERRFGEFGLHTRNSAPKEAAAWRVAATPGEGAPAAKKGGGSWSWWFFGKPAFSEATPSAATGQPAGGHPAPPAPQAPPPPPPPPPSKAERPADVSAPSAGSAGGSAPLRHGWAMSTASVQESAVLPTPTRGKAMDDETDVDAVLERLKRCQVYCPEDEQILPHK